MASEPFKRIALLDLETDGFHPRVNNILEVGLVIVEVATLQDIYAHRGLVRQPWIGATLWSPLADAQCREIHTKSGLWAHLNDANYNYNRSKISNVIYSSHYILGSAHSWVGIRLALIVRSFMRRCQR